MDESSGSSQELIELLIRRTAAEWQMPLSRSADGRFVALTLQPAERAVAAGEAMVHTTEGIRPSQVGCRAVVVDLETGQFREPFAAGATSLLPEWSPVGSRLAANVQHDGFVCLGVWDAARDHVRLYRDLRLRPVFGDVGPAWTSDGRGMVVRTWRDGDAPAAVDQAHRVDADDDRLLRYSHDPDATPDGSHGDQGVTDWHAGTIRYVDLESGESRLLTTASCRLGPVSPDDCAVALRRTARQRPDQVSPDTDLVLQPLDGGPARVLACGTACSPGPTVSWSPDGRWVCYTTQEQYLPARVWVVPADGSAEPRELSRESARLDPYGPPRWTADGRWIVVFGLGVIRSFAIDGSEAATLEMPEGFRFWRALQSPHGQVVVPAPDGRWPLVVTSAASQQHALAMLDFEARRIEVVTELPGQWPALPDWLALAHDGGSCVVLSQDVDRPEELWEISLPGGTTRRAATFNPALEGREWGTGRLLDWRDAAGEPRQGALLLPPGWDGKPLPVICCLYQGRHAYQVTSFGLGEAGMVHGQVLASHGYAVFWPDLVLPDQGLRQAVGEQLEAGVNALLESGVADPQRIGVMGQSCGGYCTVAALTTTSRFRAGVAISGITDLVGFYTSLCPDGNSYGIAWAENGAGRLGGTLWERREAYIENSPLFHLDSVTAPLLLVHGSEDYGVPETQARSTFTALRRLERRVELLIYQYEGHVPTLWAEPNYRDFCRRVLAWFDEHLAERG